MAKKKDKEEGDVVVVGSADLDTLCGGKRQVSIVGVDGTKGKILLRLDQFGVDDIESLEGVVANLQDIIEELEEERDINEDDEDLEDDEDEDDDEEPEEDDLDD